MGEKKRPFVRIFAFGTAIKTLNSVQHLFEIIGHFALKIYSDIHEGFVIPS